MCTIYAEEEGRLFSFRDWKYPFVDSKELAKAGFYNLRSGDNVRCAFCAIVIGNWEKGDIPIVEHRKFSPNCPFLGVDVCGRYELLPNSIPENYSKISTKLEDRNDSDTNKLYYWPSCELQ